MNKFFLLFLFLLIFTQTEAQRPRLVVLTDIGQDPDDQQSMVRLLHYANEFQIEGIIATADNNQENEAPVIRDDIVHTLIDQYNQCLPNLKVHADGFPDAGFLHQKVKKGSNKGGTQVPVEEFIGEGFDTEGSNHIIEVTDMDNPQPVYIAVWGGACDLAQALWSVKNSRSEAETSQFIKKLRVYFIGKQDASNQWIIDNFPNLWLILALDRGGDKWQSGYRGMFWGGDMSNTSREWIHENLHGHSTLASNYPDKAYTGGEDKNPHMALKEGDTPSMLYFLPNGLNAPEHPEWGGWGGRFSEEKPNFYRDADDTFYDTSTGKKITSPRATVFRWRKDFQNDFMARADWGATNQYTNANHHPIALVNGHMGEEPLQILASPGKKIKLDAWPSTDPDRDKLTFEWFVYPEAGTYEGDASVKEKQKGKAEIKIPRNANNESIHIICRISDNGTPSLCSYKRIIIHVL